MKRQDYAESADRIKVKVRSWSSEAPSGYILVRSIGLDIIDWMNSFNSFVNL